MINTHVRQPHLAVFLLSSLFICPLPVKTSLLLKRLGAICLISINNDGVTPEMLLENARRQRRTVQGGSIME